MKNVIITGASGFLGEHFVELLKEKEINIWVLVRENKNTLSNVFSNNLNIVYCDMENIFDIKDKLPREADALYHFAWSGVSTTCKNEEYIQIKNIEYSLNVLKLAKELKVKKVIYPGSVSEYAYNNGLVTGLEAPSPSDFYSASKVAVHYICDIYAKQNDLNFIWTLIPSIYGPKREDNNLITYTVKSLLNGEEPKYTKLEQIWDYIYIDDLMEALYLIGLYGKKGSIYPIGTGKSRPMLYYVETIKELMDKNINLRIGELPYKTNRVDNSIVDISKLQNDTGFTPKYTFKQGIIKTIEYFENKNNHIN